MRPLPTNGRRHRLFVDEMRPFGHCALAAPVGRARPNGTPARALGERSVDGALKPAFVALEVEEGVAQQGRLRRRGPQRRASHRCECSEPSSRADGNLLDEQVFRLQKAREGASPPGRT